MLQAKPATDEATESGPSAVQAVRLAVVASRVGYGDMEGLVLRVLALRPTPGKSDSPLLAREKTLQMAFVLALTDPAAARTMLQTLEPSAETIEDRATWFRAWGLADPHHAAELAEKELGRVKPGGDATRPIDDVLAAVGSGRFRPTSNFRPFCPVTARTRSPIGCFSVLASMMTRLKWRRVHNIRRLCFSITRHSRN